MKSGRARIDMDARTKPMYSRFLLLAGAILRLIVYYYAYPLWVAVGLRSTLTDSLMLEIYRSGTFSFQVSVKFVCLFFATVSAVVRSGSSKDSSWLQVLGPLLCGPSYLVPQNIRGWQILHIPASD